MMGDIVLWLDLTEANRIGLAMRFDVREGATTWLAAGHTALGALL